MGNELARHQDPFEDDDDDTQLVRVESAVARINKSEIEAQIDVAHKYPRNIKRFKQRALSLACESTEVAEACIYALPRGDKPIKGPSVRLAEICASTYGNIHVGARPMDVGETDVTAQGVAWDLETNFRASVEAKRRITNKNGGRYNDDMIVVTQNAAASIAFRNAIFRVIPRAFVDEIYRQVLKVAIGDATTLTARRAEVLERLGKMGADQARVLNAFQKESIEEIGLAELETLIGFGTAIKNGDKKVDELFPAPLKEVPGSEPGQQGKRMSLKKDKATEPKPVEAKAAQPPAEFVMSTSAQRREIRELITGARIQESDVCAWYKCGSIEELSRDQIEDAKVRIAELAGAQESD